MNFGYRVAFLTIDKGFIEKVGPAGFTQSIFNITTNVVRVQKSSMFHTIFMLISFALIFYALYLSIFCGVFNVLNLELLTLFFSFILIISYKSS